MMLGQQGLTSLVFTHETAENTRYNVTAIWDDRETDFSNSVFLGPSVGIDEPTTSTIAYEVYPNPVKDQLTLQGEGLRHVSLISITGATVFDSDITGNGMAIDVKALPQGLYLLRVRTNDGVRVSKVLKR